jgi:hypothetical protein
LLGHATASILKKAIMDSFKADGLELKQLLMLSRDSPFVNLSLENMIQNEMKKIDCSLLKIGGCPVHVVHNGFKAGNDTYFILLGTYFLLLFLLGLSSSGWNIHNKCTDIYS